MRQLAFFAAWFLATVPFQVGAASDCAKGHDQCKTATVPIENKAWTPHLLQQTYNIPTKPNLLADESIRDGSACALTEPNSCRIAGLGETWDGTFFIEGNRTGEQLYNDEALNGTYWLKTSEGMLLYNDHDPSYWILSDGWVVGNPHDAVSNGDAAILHVSDGVLGFESLQGGEWSFIGDTLELPGFCMFCRLKDTCEDLNMSLHASWEYLASTASLCQVPGTCSNYGSKKQCKKNTGCKWSKKKKKCKQGKGGNKAKKCKKISAKNKCKKKKGCVWSKAEEECIVK